MEPKRARRASARLLPAGRRETLVGSESGALYELSIEEGGKKERVKQLLTLGEQPITGLLQASAPRLSMVAPQPYACTGGLSLRAAACTPASAERVGTHAPCCPAPPCPRRPWAPAAGWCWRSAARGCTCLRAGPRWRRSSRPTPQVLADPAAGPLPAAVRLLHGRQGGGCLLLSWWSIAHLFSVI